MSEDFKTYAQLHAELAALKAERTELREALEAIASAPCISPWEGGKCRCHSCAARAALAKGKPDAAAAARQNQEDAIRAGS